MPTWILPSDSHAPGDTGHTSDHNHIVDDLSIIAEFLPVTGAAPVLGQITYQDVGPTPTQLNGNTTTTKKFLTQTGTGTVSAAPSWGLIAAADLPTGTTSTQGALQLDGTAGDIQPVGLQAAGAAGLAADAKHVHATPMTAQGDLLTMNSTPAPARLAVGAVNNLLGSSGTAPAWQIGYTLQSQTAAAGFTLANSTNTIITWSVPNDGAIHHLLCSAYVFATATMTGGQINMSFTDQGGNVISGVDLVNGGTTTGNANWNFQIFPVKAGTTVTISQGTALTAGAAKCWAEIWGC